MIKYYKWRIQPAGSIAEGFDARVNVQKKIGKQGISLPIERLSTRLITCFRPAVRSNIRDTLTRIVCSFSS